MIRLLCDLLAILVAFSSSSTHKSPVLESVGEYERTAFYSDGGTQDFTDYGKYSFTEPNFDDNEYFTLMDDAAVERMNEYMDNYDGWIKLTRSGEPLNELSIHYDFDRGIIDRGDYYYIYDRMGEPCGQHEYTQFDSYNIYFYDSQSGIMYYFFSNL